MTSSPTANDVTQPEQLSQLQRSILQLLSDHVMFTNKLRVRGVLSVQADDVNNSQEIVIKLDETLEKVTEQAPGCDVRLNTAILYQLRKTLFV